MSLIGRTLFAIVWFSQPVCFVQADEKIELVQYMGSLQYFAHKTSLALESRNRQLAAFYTHELEEVIEILEKVDSYDDYPVGDLVESKLEPSFEEFEAALKSGNWNETSIKFDSLIQACNACHKATDHGFIRIERPSVNPFMQSFEATGEHD
jgi:hypothetical protein